MLIIMKKGAGEAELDGVKEFLINRDFDIHQSTGANRTIIGVIGDTNCIDREELGRLGGVHVIFKIPEER